MVRAISGGDEGRGREGGRKTFEDTLQRGCGGSRRGGRAGFSAAPTRQQAEQVRSFVAAFLDILRALSDRFGGGQGGGGTTMPVEPGGGIGDGAGPIPIDGQPIPVEPDGGIGDGAGPPEFTTLAVGEEDGGIDFGPFPVDPDDGKPPQATTLAIGEEDGGGQMPVEPGGGIGDGAGPPEFTTLAIGEEDGGIDFGPFPVDPDDGKPPQATTLAIGEEDGGGMIPVEPDGGIGDGAGPPPFIVDGEERFPVEPDGGIGDGAGPPPFARKGGIPFEDISRFGRRSD